MSSRSKNKPIPSNKAGGADTEGLLKLIKSPDRRSSSQSHKPTREEAPKDKSASRTDSAVPKDRAVAHPSQAAPKDRNVSRTDQAASKDRTMARIDRTAPTDRTVTRTEQATPENSFVTRTGQTAGEGTDRGESYVKYTRKSTYKYRRLSYSSRRPTRDGTATHRRHDEST